MNKTNNKEFMSAIMTPLGKSLIKELSILKNKISTLERFLAYEENADNVVKSMEDQAMMDHLNLKLITLFERFLKQTTYQVEYLENELNMLRRDYIHYAYSISKRSAPEYFPRNIIELKKKLIQRLNEHERKSNEK